MRLLGGSLAPGDQSFYFKHYSRGKRAVALDLASEEGREALYRLVDTADVFLTSFLPETRRKLKIDVDDIRARKPDIVYARGTGQGPQGPEAERGGYDGATWWCRGSLAWSTMQVTGIEFPSGMIGHGDGMSGMTLAGGICAALLKRALTGETSVVDGSLLGTAIWFNGPALIQRQFSDTPPGAGLPPRRERQATANTYRTKDGRFLILSMLGDADADWADFCRHLDRSDLASDPRFATKAAREQHRQEAVAIFDEIFSTRTFEEWQKALVTTRGVWSPVQTTAEVYEDPQTKANGFLRPVRYATGEIILPVPPILFDEEAGDPPPAPDFAEHTDSVLQEVGYSPADLDRLRAAGMIA